MLRQTWAARGVSLGVPLCFHMAREAQDRADWSVQQARDTYAEIQALRDRICDLERRLDNLTPGIGQPGLRVAI